jgi:hypothetical protein
MRRLRHSSLLLAALFALALAFVLGAPHARAQAAAVPPVVVMVEPGGGLPNAELLGTELSRDLSLRIVSLRDVSPGSQPPQAIVTLAVDREHLINAVYWDRAGRFEVLSAPVKSNMAASHVEAVAIALSSALLQRHVVELSRGIAAEPGAAAQRTGGQLDMASASRFLYDALGRLGLLRRRTIELSIDEF